MLTRIHQRLGTVGFVISIVALVAALGGGAYAASGGLTGKQKKEVEKIAKKYAGQPGSPGATGPAGSAGAKGDTGSVGANGTNGSPGEKGDRGEKGNAGNPGESVTIISLNPGEGGCVGGGVKFVNGSGEGHACNGENGTGGGGGYPETLPSGRTETGLWESLGESGFTSSGITETTISFPLPLAAAPTETVLISRTSTVEEDEKCPGSFVEPKAAGGGGILCVYPQSNEAVSPFFGVPFTFGAGLFFPEDEKLIGSWAVKAG
jgi:hypothetical protein